jgi:hypothetical protein
MASYGPPGADSVMSPTVKRTRSRWPCRARTVAFPTASAERSMPWHLASVADEVGKDECHVSCATAEVEHAHSATNAGGLEQHARRGRKHPSLVIEPFELRRVAA